MNYKIAGSLSIFGGLAFAAIWFTLLFVANPDCLTSYEAAKETFLYSVTSDDSRLFIGTLLSLAACLICGSLLLVNKFSQQAMYVIAAHAFLAALAYDWSLVIAIALPLIYFKEVVSNA